MPLSSVFFFFFQAEDGIRDKLVTGVQTCALPILEPLAERLAEKLADFVEGPGFEAAVEKYVTLERWAEDGLAHPAPQRAGRGAVAGQRARPVRRRRPLPERVAARRVRARAPGIA